MKAYVVEWPDTEGRPRVYYAGSKDAAVHYRHVRVNRDRRATITLVEVPVTKEELIDFLNVRLGTS